VLTVIGRGECGNEISFCLRGNVRVHYIKKVPPAYIVRVGRLSEIGFENVESLHVAKK